MSKPDDIPQDVWTTAAKMAAEYDDWVAHGNTTASLSLHAIEAMADTIARAVMAERERCAKIAGHASKRYAADQDAAKKAKDRFKARDFESMRIAAGGIAVAIRGEP